MSDWAQYYTPADQSERLIEQVRAPLGDRAVSKVVDLGAGKGDLLAAALHRWPTAHLLGVDIDRRNTAAVRCRFPGARCLTADALKFDLPRRLGVDQDSIDVAVANPPYGPLQSDAQILRVLKQVGLDDVISPKRIRREVVFLAQNLRLLRPGGAMVAIVPQGLGTTLHFAEFRAALMERHGLHKAVELPVNTFPGAEARTLALFMIKGANSPSVECKTDAGAVCHLNAGQVRERIDARFHAMAESREVTLGSIGAEIRRGSLMHNEALQTRAPVFHTTSFHLYPSRQVRLPDRGDVPASLILAERGDILLARVGTRCLGQIAWVKSGTAVLTDCVYRIRVHSALQSGVFDALGSSRGQDWLATVAHGSCALVISKRDLLQFPLEP